MISNTGGLCALVESRYLGREVTGYSLGNIQVNPQHALYVADKIIIINIPNYPKELIEILVKNKNTVISRIPCDIPGVIYNPYLPRLCPEIMWDGSIVDTLSDKYEMTEDKLIKSYFFDSESGILYVPKARSYEYTSGSFLEYLAHQVGFNIYPDCNYVDLDIVKTGKGYFPEKIKKRRF